METKTKTNADRIREMTDDELPGQISTEDYLEMIDE